MRRRAGVQRPMRTRLSASIARRTAGCHGAPRLTTIAGGDGGGGTSAMPAAAAAYMANASSSTMSVDGRNPAADGIGAARAPSCQRLKSTVGCSTAGAADSSCAVGSTVGCSTAGAADSSCAVGSSVTGSWGSAVEDGLSMGALPAPASAAPRALLSEVSAASSTVGPVTARLLPPMLLFFLPKLNCLAMRFEKDICFLIGGLIKLSDDASFKSASACEAGIYVTNRGTLRGRPCFAHRRCGFRLL